MLLIVAEYIKAEDWMYITDATDMPKSNRDYTFDIR